LGVGIPVLLLLLALLIYMLCFAGSSSTVPMVGEVGVPVVVEQASMYSYGYTVPPSTPITGPAATGVAFV